MMAMRQQSLFNICCLWSPNVTRQNSTMPMLICKLGFSLCCVQTAFLSARGGNAHCAWGNIAGSCYIGVFKCGFVRLRNFCCVNAHVAYLFGNDRISFIYIFEV
uniref:Uncharacterized protein n=1 Tax=Opuntia streptacantha TaxID=393608 RepID=A0A7C9DSQ1_OPUST